MFHRIAELTFLTQQYGGYNSGGGGGYGQTNPYEQQGSRYDQNAGNPYAQQQQAAPQAPYAGRHQQGSYDNLYSQGQSAGNGGYGKSDYLVLRTPVNNAM